MKRLYYWKDTKNVFNLQHRTKFQILTFWVLIYLLIIIGYWLHRVSCPLCKGR